MEDQFAAWRHAVAGNRMDTERGNPRSGYYRALTKDREGTARIEAVCIYREDDGKLECIRDVIGDGSWMSAEQIDDFFGQICMYPITEELYAAVTERQEEWPPEYGAKGRLTTKDQGNGVVWTPSYGRKRLGLEVKDGEGPQPANEKKPAAATPIQSKDQEVPKDTTVGSMLGAIADGMEKPLSADQQTLLRETRTGEATTSSPVADTTSENPENSGEVITLSTSEEGPENPRAVIGGNNPPEDEPEGHKFEGEQTPDKLAHAEISAVAAKLKKWLKSIGGKPRSKAEADYVGDHAAEFKKLLDKAESAREIEKKPHLEAGREIDAKWKLPKDLAESCRKGCKATAKKWVTAENDRIDAEHAAAKAAAEEQNGGQVDDSIPDEPKHVTGVGNVKTLSVRKTTTYVVTDYRMFLRSMLAGDDGELPQELKDAADKIAKRRAEEAPGVEKQITESMQ